MSQIHTVVINRLSYRIGIGRISYLFRYFTYGVDNIIGQSSRAYCPPTRRPTTNSATYVYTSVVTITQWLLWKIRGWGTVRLGLGPCCWSWASSFHNRPISLPGFLSPHTHGHAGVYRLLFLCLSYRRIVCKGYLRRGLTQGYEIW